MRVLVGFDGSQGGRDALEMARALATALVADVVAVTVVPYGPLPITATLLREDEIVEAEPLLAEARERLAGLSVETRMFGGGTPAGVLTDLAEEERFDLLVVGSPHRGPIGRALIGSVANSLLLGAPCGVLVAPRGYATEIHRVFEQVAVAYDGTPEAGVALRRAEAIALQTGARIRVLTVVAPAVSLGVIGYVPPLPPEPRWVVEEGIRSIGAGVSADSEVLHGPPAEALAKACEEGVDLIIAGSRGYGPMLRVLVGSVSSALIHNAPCPVLIVPRPRAEKARE